MKHQEKKFLVNSFDGIKNKLEEMGADKADEVISIHYYAQANGNDVVKAVEYNDHCEIHILKESDGKFILTERIPIKSVAEGLQWLRDKGYKFYTVVKMQYGDYDFRDGRVGLYIINDFLLSVILDFPTNQHAAMEKLFGLNTAEQIVIPYNKQLEQLGKLELKPLL